MTGASLPSATNSTTVYFQIGSSICDPRQYCCNTLMKDLFKVQLAIGGWGGSAGPQGSCLAWD
jgi:hypothetical protein